MTGYTYTPRGILWCGNGDIPPVNWSEEFQKDIRTTSRKNPSINPATVRKETQLKLDL